MKGLSKAAFLLVATMAAAAASAAGVDGKWQGMQGENTLTYVFKADGEKLTGTIENSQMPGPVEIHDGKVKGNEISFNLSRNIQGTDMKIEWTGKLEGDQLKLTRSMAGGGGGGAPGGAAGGPGGGGGGNVEVIAKRVMEEKK
jgi:hypothetical protein